MGVVDSEIAVISRTIFLRIQFGNNYTQIRLLQITTFTLSKLSSHRPKYDLEIVCQRINSQITKFLINILMIYDGRCELTLSSLNLPLSSSSTTIFHM